MTDADIDRIALERFVHAYKGAWRELGNMPENAATVELLKAFHQADAIVHGATEQARDAINEALINGAGSLEVRVGEDGLPCGPPETLESLLGMSAASGPSPSRSEPPA